MCANTGAAVGGSTVASTAFACSTGIASSNRAACAECRRQERARELLLSAHPWLRSFTNGSWLKFCAGHRHVALRGLEEHAAVGDLDDPALERADLDVIARRVVLTHVVRADQVREVLARAEREHECDAAEHGARGHRRNLDQELDVDAELIDADHDAGDHDHALREPTEQAALADAEAVGRLLEDVARQRSADQAQHDDHHAADRLGADSRASCRSSARTAGRRGFAAHSPRRSGARSSRRPTRSRGSSRAS